MASMHALSSARALLAATIAAAVLSPTITLADEIHVPGDWPMIQMAIVAASPGDVIIVQQGQYPEHIDLLGKAITVRSVDPTNPAIVMSTHIIAPGSDPTVSCVNGEGPDTVISGLTITHLNAAASGTGMRCVSASPTVTYCNFWNNIATSGGGMYIDGGVLTIQECTFAANSAEEDGGGIYSDSADLEVTGCTFDGNSTGNEIGNNGAGIHGYRGSVTVTDCTFIENSSGFFGGGIYADRSDLSVVDCTFTDNSAAQGGGGMACGAGDTAITNCIFTGNSGGGLGGGVYMTDHYDVGPVVSNCTFENNSATLGGGMKITNQTTNATVTDCTFTGNSAVGYGGGIHFDAGSPLVTSCTFAGNTADHGAGGISNYLTEPRIVNCTFEGNTDDASVDAIGGAEWSISSAGAPPPTGACCIPGGVCMVGLEADCLATGGTYVGDGTDCATANCPGPTPAGACCLGDGCIVALEADCLAAGGTYMGNETDCATANCPDPCPPDVTGDGVIDVLDLLELLSAWGPCP